MVLQGPVVLPYSLGHHSLSPGQIEELGDCGHINPLGAGGAVAAIHAVTLPADLGEGGKGGGIIPFGLVRLLVIQAGLELFPGFAPARTVATAGLVRA